MAFQAGCLALDVWILAENVFLFGSFIHFPLMKETVGSKNQMRSDAQDNFFFFFSLEDTYYARIKAIYFHW